MGSVSVSSCICCMFVSCVHPVAVLNAMFCITCSLLMLVKDGGGILQIGLMTALWVFFYLPYAVAVRVFIACRGLCACTEML